MTAQHGNVSLLRNALVIPVAFQQMIILVKSGEMSDGKNPKYLKKSKFPQVFNDIIFKTLMLNFFCIYMKAYLLRK